jgi:hypothetical protein
VSGKGTKLGEGEGSKLGEPCPKVKLSQDSLPIEPLTQQQFLGLLRFGILTFGIITFGKSLWRQDSHLKIFFCKPDHFRT